MFHGAGFLNVDVKVIHLLSAEHRAGTKNVLQKVILLISVDFIESLCYEGFSCPKQMTFFLPLEEKKLHVFKQWLVWRDFLRKYVLYYVPTHAGLCSAGQKQRNSFVSNTTLA